MAPLYETEGEQEILQTKEERPLYIKEWLKKNTFHHSKFKNVESLIEKKHELGLTISLCFPTLNEEKTVGKEITLMRRELMEKHPLLDEITVIDSGSIDRTEQEVL